MYYLRIFTILTTLGFSVAVQAMDPGQCASRLSAFSSMPKAQQNFVSVYTSLIKGYLGDQKVSTSLLDWLKSLTPQSPLTHYFRFSVSISPSEKNLSQSLALLFKNLPDSNVDLRPELFDKIQILLADLNQSHVQRLVAESEQVKLLRPILTWLELKPEARQGAKYQNYVNQIAFSPTEQIVAAGWTNSVVQVFDSIRGTLLYRLDLKNFMNISHLEFSKDGARLLVAQKSSFGSEIKVWDIKNRTQIVRPSSSSNPTGGAHDIQAAWTESGEEFVAAGLQRKGLPVFAMNATTGQTLKLIGTSEQSVLALKMSKSGRRLAVKLLNEGTKISTIETWDTRTWKLLDRFETPIYEHQWPTLIDFSSNESHLVTYTSIDSKNIHLQFRNIDAKLIDRELDLPYSFSKLQFTEDLNQLIGISHNAMFTIDTQSGQLLSRSKHVKDFTLLKDTSYVAAIHNNRMDQTTLKITSTQTHQVLAKLKDSAALPKFSQIYASPDGLQFGALNSNSPYQHGVFHLEQILEEVSDR